MKRIHVHTGPLNEDGAISRETMVRVDHGIKLYDVLEADEIMFTAGYGQFRDGTWMTHPLPTMAQIMANYAREERGFRGNVLLEEVSKDTFGEVFYSIHLPQFRRPEGVTWHVSSPHHMIRCVPIAKKVTPSDQEFFHSCPHFVYDTEEERIRRAAHEAKGYELLMSQFGDIEDGDGPALEARMFEVHGLYNKLPEEERVRIYTKPEGQN